MNKLINLLEEKGIQLNTEKNEVLSGCSKTTQVIPLIHQRVLSVKGPDTEKFLQGQLTCDVRDVFSRGSSLGAHCNIKGHMLSLFRMIKVDQEQVWLRMSHDIFDSACNNLKKYIVFSKAEAEEVSDTIAGIGVTGPGAQALIENLFDQSPTEDNGILTLSNGVVIRVPGNRYEIWMEQEALAALIDKLPDEVGLGSTDNWLLSEIDTATPDLRKETQEAFIPQMTNFQALDGVSFSKGCYTGQEIVTRLQHRGQLKKPMYLAEVESNTRPLPGQGIDTEEKPNAGQVVLAAPCGENRFRLLAVINKTLAESHELRLSGENKAIELLELPYPLDPDLFTRK
ncbi:folate-binding protein [Neptuniibacter sp.]|uniref:CAF17-like 4Fe-4S cluster assembly/insertion protein YgfZ n=1 Tax=Neptuniibacter sp. TaxID=1962643 RepID=UPI0026271049|nr:folate-binding protein [Neptuniibacter sp.]MCP4596707.1 folate-binding protein YgfZ [Neptuniibacter sp.]